MSAQQQQQQQQQHRTREREGSVSGGSGAGAGAGTVGFDAIAKALLAGGVAGGVSRTVVAPLERLKILLQVQGSSANYKGVWHSLSHMARHEGIRGLLKGNGANCLRIVPNSAVKFFAYERGSLLLLQHLREKYGIEELNSVHRLVAGACAGILAMSATYPLEMVRGRLTILNEAMGAQSPYKGIGDAAFQIVRAEGVMALYKGWLPSVIGVVPYVGLNFAVYETLKKELVYAYGLKEENELSKGIRLASGALAGSVGQTIAYPLDVVRRRLQISGWEAGKHAMASLASGGPLAGGESTRAAVAGTGVSNASNAAKAGSSSESVVVYKGMVDCFRKIVAEEGVSALFRGLWPNYLKVVPSIAIAFVVYEEMKDLMGVNLKISSS